MIKEKLIYKLSELKKQGAKALKAEMQTENLSFDEIFELKECAKLSGLDFTIKIGGCEAYRDISDAKKIGADNIVCPMVESEYCASKFLEIAKPFYDFKNLFINIETVEGFKNLDKILDLDFAGVIFGRSDFAHSVGLKCEDVNCKTIFDYAQECCLKVKNTKNGAAKKFIAGGAVSDKSIDFFKQIPFLDGFETRKIVFEKEVLKNNPKNAILNALEFEILWLKNRKKTPETSDNNLKRLSLLEKRMENNKEGRKIL